MDTPTLDGDDISEKARALVNKVSDHLGDNINVLRDSATTARYHSEDFIQSNPWPAVVMAAGCGFLLGVLVSRR